MKSQGKKGCLRDASNFFFLFSALSMILGSALLILLFFASTTSALVALFAIPVFCYSIYFIYLSTRNEVTSNHVWIELGVMALCAALYTVEVTQMDNISPMIFAIAPLPLLSGIIYGCCLKTEENSYADYLSKFFVGRYHHITYNIKSK